PPARARMVPARGPAAAAAAAAAEHDHLPHDDVGPVADVALVVLGLRVLEATLDVEAVALVYVLLDEVGQPIEERAAVPLGLLLLLAAAIGEGAICRGRELRHLASAGDREDLRLRTDVSDQHDLVEGPSHSNRLSAGRFP